MTTVILAGIAALVYFSSLYGWVYLIKRRLGFAVWPFPLTISLEAIWTFCQNFVKL